MKNTNKKKLMILIWDMGIGGVQKRVKDLIIDIDSNYSDWEIHLLIRHKRPGFFEKEIKTKTKTIIHHYPRYESYTKSKSLAALLWIIKEYYKINPRVSLTFLDHLSIIMVLVRLTLFWRKTRLILNEGILTSDYLKIYRKKVWLWKFMVQKTYPLADKIIVPTNAIKNDLSINFLIPSEKIIVIPNWTLFKPHIQSKKLYDLIFIGRYEKEKDPLSLIEVVNLINKTRKNVKLCMLGRGSLENTIRQKILTNGLSDNIFLKGFHKDITPFLKKSEILVLPTINEGMPNVVLEAAAYQVPSVTLDFPGAREVVTHSKTGYIVNNPRQLSYYALKLIKDKKLRRKMGKAAQSHILKNFSLANQNKFISMLLENPNL